MYEVAHVSYHIDGTWTDETFFRGTKEECLQWLIANCASSFEGVEEQFYLGSKRLDIYKAN